MVLLHELYDNMFNFIAKTLRSDSNFSNVTRMVHLRVTNDSIKLSYKGYPISVELSDNASSAYTLDKITTTFIFKDWSWTGSDSDRQVKRYISVENSKLDVKELLASLDKKIEAHEEELKIEAIQDKYREASKQRVKYSTEALREVFPDMIGARCKGIYVECDKHLDETYLLRGQSKKYTLEEITLVVNTLSEL